MIKVNARQRSEGRGDFYCSVVLVSLVLHNTASRESVSRWLGDRQKETNVWVRGERLWWFMRSCQLLCYIVQHKNTRLPYCMTVGRDWVELGRHNNVLLWSNHTVLISGQKHWYVRGTWLLLVSGRGSQSNSLISNQWLPSLPVTSSSWPEIDLYCLGEVGLVKTIPVISQFACRGWPENDLSWLVFQKFLFSVLPIFRMWDIFQISDLSK